MSAFFTFMYPIFGVFQFHFEKTKLIALATFVGAGLNIILNFIFINIFGYYAAGYTTLVCFIVFSLAHYLLMRKMCRDNLNSIYPYKTKTILIISLLFMAVGFIYLITYQNIIARYSLTFLLLIGLIIKRKYILNNIKGIFSVKKQKN